MHGPPMPRHFPCRLDSPVLFTGRADLFTSVWPEVMWIDLLFKTIMQTIHFHIRLCSVKIDSAVSLGEMPSSEFAQCVLWKIVWSESGSKSLSDTTGKVLVLVQRVVLLFFLQHHDTAVSCLTNDMLTTSSSSTDCYNDWCQASPIVCCTCCLLPATSFVWHSRSYTML